MKMNKAWSPSGLSTRIALPVAFSAIALAIHGCGGGGGSSSPAAAPGPAPTVVAGVVAVGAAVPGATVTVKDSSASTADVTGTADASGAYSLDVSSLVPPLVVTATGTLNGEPVTIAAVVPTLSANANNTTNVTSLTNAIAALIAPGGDLNALSTPATLASAATATAVTNASTLVVNTLKTDPEFSALLGANFNPLTTPFTANGTGPDAVLDRLSVAVSATGVSITPLAAPVAGNGAPPSPIVLTASQTTTPTVVPTLPPSVASSNLPTAAELAAIAKKLEDCLALPLAQRVTLDVDNNVTAVSPTCSWGPSQWKSQGGNWAERIGQNTLRFNSLTGSKAGAPTIAAVLSAPNFTGTTFQHPYCNTATCVIMNIPLTSVSGKPWNSLWTVGRLNGQWNVVGDQLPYAMGIEHRLYRKSAVNTALALANPSNYSLQDRLEASLRLNFNPDQSGSNPNIANVRTVVWKGPGLPAAGVVTHRSQRCGTDDRFPITNQEGALNVNNSSSTQFWNNGGTIDFVLSASALDGSAITTPTPSTNWSTNASPVNQEVRSSPLSGTIPAWSAYTAEIYYFSNTTNAAPDEVIVVRNATAYETAALGATKNWPTLASTFIDQYLKPTGSGAGLQTALGQAINWTNASDSFVSFAYLFGQNRLSLTNSQNETAGYWKRANMFFRPSSLGASTAISTEWAPNLSGTELSPSTASSGTNPNPRCTSDDLQPLDANNTNAAYREAGLQFRGPDRKLYQLTHFWSN